MRFFSFLDFGNFLIKGARSSLKEDLVSFFYSGRVREHRERLSWHHSKRKLSKKRERKKSFFLLLFFDDACRRPTNADWPVPFFFRQHLSTKPTRDVLLYYRRQSIYAIYVTVGCFIQNILSSPFVLLDTVRRRRDGVIS